jgi:DNA-binding transcriptional MerR regulator
MWDTVVVPRRSTSSIHAPRARRTAAALPSADAAPLLRIQEVAAATGLTPRSIRYYEEMGLLRPAARSQGDYRLYDASDLERLRFIRGLRDDAGFSLAEIALLLEDEEARIRDRERFNASADTAEKRAIVHDLVERMDRQVATLEAKAGRLRAMIEAAEARREHLRAHLAELEGAASAHGGHPRGGDGPGPEAAR